MFSLNSRISSVAIVVAFLSPSIAHADLESKLAAYVVQTDANGNDTFSKATAVKPGQVIEYRLQHTNTFDHAIGGVAVTGPVPKGGQLISSSQSSDVPATFEVQGDFDPDRPGKEWSTLPAMRIVVQPDGTRLEEVASADLFTAVRWRFDGTIQQDASVHNTYRVEVK